MSKRWVWLIIGAVVVVAVVSLATGCAPSKPASEDATQGQRFQDNAVPSVEMFRHAPEKNDVPTEGTEAAKPEAKYRTGQVWQDCENRGYVKIVELLSPESPENAGLLLDEVDPYRLAGTDRSRWDPNPYVHILRLDDNETGSYRKKDFEKRFRYAPEGRQ